MFGMHERHDATLLASPVQLSLRIKVQVVVRQRTYYYSVLIAQEEVLSIHSDNFIVLGINILFTNIQNQSILNTAMPIVASKVTCRYSGCCVS